MFVRESGSQDRADADDGDGNNVSSSVIDELAALQV